MSPFDPPVLDPRVVEHMSRSKGEPSWMTQMRLGGLQSFERTSSADRLAADTPDLDLHDISSVHPGSARHGRAGEPEHSEVAYPEHRDDLEREGIVFCDIGIALREHPRLVREHVGPVVPPGDSTYAALNTCLWSGGSFIYVPPGVECDVPLEVGIDAFLPGRFERTLIIADEGARVHYIEGCSTPVYVNGSLRSAVVEIIVRPHARVTCTTIQNWSPNVHHVVTRRARVEAHGHVELIGGDIGSKRTMTYSSVHLVGVGAIGELRSVAVAGEGQHRDVRGEVVHAAHDTSSEIVSKSIGKGGGITTCRGLVRVDQGARGCQSHVECDALVLDEDSICETLPQVVVGEADTRIARTATVSRISDEQIFSLTSRGLSEDQAAGLVAGGFVEPVTSALPDEYAVELTRMIELRLLGSVG